MESLATIGWSWLAAALLAERRKQLITNAKRIKAEVNLNLFLNARLLKFPRFQFSSAA
jgi:hypothetical protein